MKGWESTTPEQLAALYGKRLARAGPGKVTGKPIPARPKSIQGLKSGDLADVLLGQIEALKLPLPQREYQPWMDRKFRLDLAWVDALICAEVDGSEWSHGRHGRGGGMASDCYKQNRLALDGWTVLRFVGSQVRNGYAIETLTRALG